MSTNEKSVRRRERATGQSRLAMPEALPKAWRQRASRLEVLAMELVEGVTSPVEETPANGQVMNPRLRAGLQLLAAADRIWDRIMRMSATGAGPRPPHAVPTSPRSLTDYRRLRPVAVDEQRHDDPL